MIKVKEGKKNTALQFKNGNPYFRYVGLSNRMNQKSQLYHSQVYDFFKYDSSF
jgi:hypothetical protein